MTAGEENTCSQCGLPLPEKRPFGRLFAGAGGDEGDERFCCLGCYIVHEVTGQRGVEGEVSWNLSRFGFGAFLSMIVMVFSLALYAGTFYQVDGDSSGFFLFRSIYRYILLAFSTPVVLLLGLPILKASIRRFPYLGMDALIAVGIFSAYFISVYSTLFETGEVYFDTATMVLVLVTFGRYLEARSKASTKQAVSRLLSLSPTEARLAMEGEDTWVPVESIRVGQKVRVLPGESFPVDGRVIEGEGSVDESSIRGTALPVFKGVGMEVYSGTIDLDGSFIVEASRVGEDRLLSRVAALLDRVKQHHGPIERMVDRVSSIFIPLVMLVAAGTFVGWLIVDGYEAGLMNALSVLLVSCPCALGLATSLAIWTAVGRAAEGGVLVQHGEYLEKIPKARGIFFDKTGTLTAGLMEYPEVHLEPAAGITRREFLQRAASLERHSNHPLANVAVEYAAGQGIRFRKVHEYQSRAGMGISGMFNRREGPVFVGRVEYMEANGQVLNSSMESEAGKFLDRGETVVYCGWGGKVRGLLSFVETERKESRAVLSYFRRKGYDVRVLTGDRSRAGIELGESSGVKVRAGLLPEEKVREIEEAERDIGPVIMVGDGINDAPALARAFIGIAMGCGADITREAADICLIGNDLRKVVWLVELGLKTRRTIIGNLFWAFSYNTICVVLAVAGYIVPVMAALAMVLSSLFVVGNSRRLRRLSFYE